MSYASADRPWAEWVAWQLEEAGYQVLVDAWDFVPGSNATAGVQRAVEQSERTIVLLSKNLLRELDGRGYWQVAWTADPAGTARRLLPVRIEGCDPPGLLGPIVAIDVFDLDAEAARERLLDRVGHALTGRAKPLRAPVLPAAERSGSREVAPVFPGLVARTVPAIWRAPPRLATFTGREELLDQIGARLDASGGVAVTALHGLGGVGKTQLAVEYSYRRAGDYTLVWWVDAEHQALLAEQLATLAPALDLPVRGDVVDDADAVLDALRRTGSWLLVFDNAEDPSLLRRWLPGGDGHVIVTSRAPDWGAVATPIEVDVLAPADSGHLLRARVHDLDDDVGRELADELGHLPLALEQVAAYLERTRVPAATYLDRFRRRRGVMLTKGSDLAYGGTVDAAWSLAVDRLRDQAPASATLLELAAFFGPAPIPLALFAEHTDRLPPPLDVALTANGDAAADLDDLTADLLGYSLARRTGNSVQVHRLVQVVLRDRQPPERGDELARTVRSLLTANLDLDAENPAQWPAWSELLPHLLAAPALHPDRTDVDIGNRARQLLVNASAYLRIRGELTAALRLARALRGGFVDRLGEDHPDTLAATSHLACTYCRLGQHEIAMDIHERTYTRSRRVLGDNHPLSLTEAIYLGNELDFAGRVESARQLHDETLSRAGRLLGADHPLTLNAANSLATTLAHLGEHQRARELHQDTLHRRRQVLGEDHPRTLESAYELARDLSRLDDLEDARALFVDVLVRQRRVLGEDHHRSLVTAYHLGKLLHDLGDKAAGRALWADTLQRQRVVLGPDHPDAQRTEAQMLVADPTGAALAYGGHARDPDQSVRPGG